MIKSFGFEVLVQGLGSRVYGSWQKGRSLGSKLFGVESTLQSSRLRVQRSGFKVKPHLPDSRKTPPFSGQSISCQMTSRPIEMGCSASHVTRRRGYIVHLGVLHENFRDDPGSIRTYRARAKVDLL